MRWEVEFTDRQFVDDLRNYMYKYLGPAPADILVLCPRPKFIFQLVQGTPYRYIYVSGDRVPKIDKLGNVLYCESLERAATKYKIRAVCVTSTKSADIHAAARLVGKVDALADARIFFQARGSDAYPILQAYDGLQKREDHVFLTSDFDDGMFESIYRHSLTKVPLKCQARDAHDLYQCLKNTQKVDGDIVEFGSYQGHSGFIMAEFIKRTGQDKKVFLCDTFSGFPAEKLGIDKFWNNTHNKADYSGVDALFKDHKFVTLVKGDFTKTAQTIPSDRFSFVMLDCDSYRGTKFAAEFAWPKLSVGGMMACEDYGHHILLGARLAIDEFCEEREGMVSLFSFFSGFRIMVKTA